MSFTESGLISLSTKCFNIKSNTLYKFVEYPHSLLLNLFTFECNELFSSKFIHSGLLENVIHLSFKTPFCNSEQAILNDIHASIQRVPLQHSLNIEPETSETINKFSISRPMLSIFFL